MTVSRSGQGGQEEPSHGSEAERSRSRLFGIAYRMLGNVVDAQDAVQEALLRLEQARAAGTAIVSAEAWLVTVITRHCIDQLRSAHTQREAYLGPWLPEPLVGDWTRAAEEGVEMAESLSLAFLVLLERLTPLERAVFLLHEVFGYAYAEIAAIVGRKESTCRQLAKRARERIAVGRPRFRASTEAGERLASEFLQACRKGDLPGLIALLTEDVALTADGGGRVPAARQPIHGVGRVARFLLGIAGQGPEGWTAAPVVVNGGVGIVVRHADGRSHAVLELEPAGKRIAAVRIIVNPDKLHGVPD
jgi:RNA polymerase sigma-70 factor, ECF subfamily